MPIFKQLCALCFAEWFSVVIYPHCGFLVIMPHIKPFYTSVFKDTRVVYNLLRHILPC